MWKGGCTPKRFVELRITKFFSWELKIWLPQSYFKLNKEFIRKNNLICEMKACGTVAEIWPWNWMALELGRENDQRHRLWSWEYLASIILPAVPLNHPVPQFLDLQLRDNNSFIRWLEDSCVNVLRERTILGNAEGRQENVPRVCWIPTMCLLNAYYVLCSLLCAGERGDTGEKDNTECASESQAPFKSAQHPW